MKIKKMTLNFYDFIKRHRNIINMKPLFKYNLLNLTSIILNNKRKIFPKNFYLLRFAGCSKGDSSIGAASAILYKNEIEIWSDSQLLGYNTSNNCAHYSGLIMGLNKALELDIQDLIVENNSTYIINLMNENINHKPNSMNEISKTALDLKMKFTSIIFRHIFRKDNQRAIDLCECEYRKMVEIYFEPDKWM